MIRLFAVTGCLVFSLVAMGCESSSSDAPTTPSPAPAPAPTPPAPTPTPTPTPTPPPAPAAPAALSELTLSSTSVAWAESADRHRDTDGPRAIRWSGDQARERPYPGESPILRHGRGWPDDGDLYRGHLDRRCTRRRHPHGDVRGCRQENHAHRPAPATACRLHGHVTGVRSGRVCAHPERTGARLPSRWQSVRRAHRALDLAPRSP